MIVSKQSDQGFPIRPGSRDVSPVAKDAACVAVLRMALADLVVFQFMAQGFHWNVKGPRFPQLHEMFGEIYEEAQVAVDPMAENIRKMGGEAPYMMGEFSRLTRIDQVATPVDDHSMIRSLLYANATVLETLKEASAIAEQIRAFGVMDFLGGRIDVHEKWAWMLGETAGA
jgi:starvation-inducible DNA-binding protein